MSFSIALLNSAICTAEGTYTYTPISLDTARALVRGRNLDSAIGHESTAQVVGQLLDRPVPVNRQVFRQEKNQIALVFKLNGRLPEAKVFTQEEIEAIGYAFHVLERVE